MPGRSEAGSGCVPEIQQNSLVTVDLETAGKTRENESKFREKERVRFFVDKGITGV
jgi:hypothetical protein